MFQLFGLPKNFKFNVRMAENIAMWLNAADLSAEEEATLRQLKERQNNARFCRSLRDGVASVGLYRESLYVFISLLLYMYVGVSLNRVVAPPSSAAPT